MTEVGDLALAFGVLTLGGDETGEEAEDCVSAAAGPGLLLLLDLFFAMTVKN